MTHLDLTRAIGLAAIASLATACGASQDQAMPDEHGFIEEAGGHLYHPVSGLTCLEFEQDIPLLRLVSAKTGRESETHLNCHYAALLRAPIFLNYYPGLSHLTTPDESIALHVQSETDMPWIKGQVWSDTLSDECNAVAAIVAEELSLDTTEVPFRMAVVVEEARSRVYLGIALRPEGVMTLRNVHDPKRSSGAFEEFDTERECRTAATVLLENAKAFRQPVATGPG